MATIQSKQKFLRAYRAPSWIPRWLLASKPSHRLPNLVNLPTPITRWDLPYPLLPPGFRLWIKRDDFTGSETSGNKARKLSFLLADALQKGCDSVVTIGGEQSNHTRSTSVAARSIGMEPHIILRTDSLPSQLGIEGNLLIEHIIGCKVWLATLSDWRKHGSDKLVEHISSKLRKDGLHPYSIPVGGSNNIGIWGYLDAMDELARQVTPLSNEKKSLLFSDIVVPTGSGSTIGGIALGAHLQNLGSRIHGFSVCDTPNYFHQHIDNIINDFASISNYTTPPSSHEFVSITDAQNKGYARSTEDELNVIMKIARATGVVLDPVYSGKAVIGMLKKMHDNPDHFQGKDILFWHTGGLLGMYDKKDDLLPLFKSNEIKTIPPL